MSVLQVTVLRSNSTAFNTPVSFQTSGGTENGKLAKAWVNFNGQGTVAIRRDFNVNSISDQGSGTYNINFSTNFGDANYCSTVVHNGMAGYQEGVYLQQVTTSYLQVLCTSSGPTDPGQVHAAFFH